METKRRLKITNIFDVLYRDNTRPFGDQPEDLVILAAQYLSPNSKVIDLGAGDGRNTIYLARGHRVRAVDVSEVGLSRIQDQARAVNLTVTTTVADLSEFIFDQSYHLVVSTFVMHYLEPSPAQNLIEQAVQHTLPAGLNAIAVFTDSGYFYTKDRLGKTPHYYPKPTELVEFYQSQGWSIHQNRIKRRRSLGGNFNHVQHLIAQKP